MALHTLMIRPVEEPPPPDAAKLLALCAERRAAFRAEHPEIGHLVESAPEEFSVWLRGLKASGALAGNRFCEWGSGLGTLTLLAAKFGMRSCGIERDPELVDVSRSLAHEAESAARFACGSFVPHALAGSCRVAGTFGATRWDAAAEPDPYVELGVPPDCFDLIYAYPWPREIDLFTSLFDTCARGGAVLWLYRDREPPLFVRKTGGLSNGEG